MTTHDRCKCGWEGTTPLPVEEIAGERLVWRVYLCRQCMSEVSPVKAPEADRADRFCWTAEEELLSTYPEDSEAPEDRP